MEELMWFGLAAVGILVVVLVVKSSSGKGKKQGEAPTVEPAARQQYVAPKPAPEAMPRAAPVAPEPAPVAEKSGGLGDDEIDRMIKEAEAKVAKNNGQ